MNTKAVGQNLTLAVKVVPPDSKYPLTFPSFLFG